MELANENVIYLGFANWDVRNQLGEPNLLLNWQQLYWGTVDNIAKA
jgi:hypothetical protein